MVAVVVVHDDAGGLALALQAAADARRTSPGRRDRVGRQAEDRCGRPRRPARSPRCGGPRSRAGSSSGRRAGRGRGSRGSCCPGRSRSSGRARPSPDPSRSRIARRSRGRSRPAVVAPGRRARRPGSSRPVGKPVERRLRRRGRRRWRRAWLPAARRRSHASKVASTAVAVGEDVRVVPLGAGQDRQRRVVGVEVAGVLVGLDDERVAAPPAGGRRRAAGDRRRQQRARRTPTGRARADQDVDEPAGGRALAVRAGDADEGRPTAASATTCCHASTGMPASRAAASSGWSGSMAVRALVTASRSGRGSPSRDVRRTCCRRDGDPSGFERRRVRRGPAGVAAGHDRAGAAPPGARRRWPRPRPPRRRGSARPGPDRPRPAHGGARPRADRSAAERHRGRRGSRPVRAGALEQELEGRRRARPLVVGPVAVPHVAPDGDARPRRRRRRRSARPAWRRCRRPARRSR